MKKEYRYGLGKVVARCPQCRRRTFKPYIDRLTGQVLDPACGRCNREIRCAYHMTPSELFSANPAAKPSASVSGSLEAMRIRQQRMSQIQRRVMDATLAAPRSLNSLYRYMTRHFGRDPTDRAFTALGVGTARYGGGSPVFWMVDRSGRIRSGKVMAYDDSTGKRIKRRGRGMVDYAHMLMHMPDFNYRSCFFGEHYAASLPDDRAVVVVESEKTALFMLARLIADGLEGRYAIVASSGASNLTCDAIDMLDDDHRLAFMLSRRVVLVPDADMVERWQAAARNLRSYMASVTVVDTRLPPYSLTGSQDLADWLVSS